MKICICCFGLFNRPKQKESLIIRKKTNKKVQKLNLNDINSSFAPFQNKKRTIILENIKQINNLSINLNSPKKNDSPYFSNLKLSYTKKKINQTPKSLYDLKDTFRCLFCGGIRCPCEDYKTNPKYAIEGLNCDIIYNEIYASQRPSNVLIEKYNLIKKFHENNIGLIVNLQRPGEHPYCGPNALDPVSGYSYSPSIFSSEGIKVKLSGWKDMDVPDSLYFMLDIIKEIYEMIKIKGKKVLVHCHAGNGRTGIVIACYLMYTYNYDAKEAVVKLREVRKKCIEKNSQMRYCCKFKKFIIQLRKIFTNEKYEVDYFIKHQCDLSIEDSYKNIYIPKIIWLCLDILFDLYFSEYNSFDNVTIYKGLNGSLDITDEDIKEIIKIVDELNNGNWDILVKNNKVIIITEIFYNWLEDSVTYCISPKRINEIFKEPNFILNIFKILNENCIDDNIVESIYENITFHLKKVELEIARYIAHFLNDIYPNEINEKSESFIEYKRMVEKISIYMLGFNIDLLLFFKSKSEENLSDDLIQEDLDYGIELTIKDCINAIDNFLHILEFLRIKIQLNVKKSYTNKTNIPPENERITHIDKKRTENLNIKHIFSVKENEYERKKNCCYCCNNKINLSILERVSKNRNFKKTSSPIKSHLLKLNQKEQNNDSNFSYFLNPKNKSNNIINKQKSIFGKKQNLNESKLILKSNNKDNNPVFRLNYRGKK